MADADYDTVHAAYRAIIAAHSDATEKGNKNRYTSVNGHMSSFLSPGGELCFRLSQKDMDSFNARFQGGPVLQYGSVMRGYVHVPEGLWSDVKAASDWFAKSWNYVSGLKPK